MKAICYSTKGFDQKSITKMDKGHIVAQFVEVGLNKQSAKLAAGHEAIIAFVNDDLREPVLNELHEVGVRYIALRCAGYNNVDLAAAKRLGIKVANVPEYSPHAIAEHTLALILALNRKLVNAHTRVRDLNFSLDGLEGFDLHGKTVGVIGTGKIGKQTIKILDGFGCDIIAYDIDQDEQFADLYGVDYAALDELCKKSDIITLHAPLTDSTHHLLNDRTLRLTKKGVMIINTSRGGLVDTKAIIKLLKTGHIGYLGIDVYEEEKGLFFEDHSDLNSLADDDIARLMTFKNVLITAHQAFLTHDALENIAKSTIDNLKAWADQTTCPNEL